jgi:glutathione S-transferase
VITPLYKVMLNLNKPELDVTPFESMLSNLDTFEKELGARGGKFFGGEHPAMIDYMIWPWFERFELFNLLGEEKVKFPKERFPKLVFKLNFLFDIFILIY